MRFNRFTITNYKGIDQCTVDLAGVVPRVLALIGLNESGKTTILEAINHFVAGDRGLQKVYGIETLSIDKSSFVPKHKQLNFNDDISIAASVTIEKDDFVAIDLAFKEVGYTLVEVPTTQDITVVQRFTFENSKYKSSGRTWTMALKARKINGTKVLRVDPDHPC
ncbi:ATP-binding protein [Sphingomonas sp. WKB10]|nr:ATP-binding protein [Sphingomonas sp. WKB10]